MLAKETFKKIIQDYGKAWENFDSKAIVSIFTEDGTYQETPFKEAFKGHKEIKEYWENVVRVKERDVKFTLGNIFVQDDTGIAEWKSNFIRNDNEHPEELRGIILAEIKNGKINKLWEYWHKKEEMI